MPPNLAMDLAIALPLSVVMGITLGLLGGGGSILTVPLLVYLVGLGPKEAIATSLFVVGATSAAALIPHARAGTVHWRDGMIFGGVAMVGAWGAGRVAEYIPGRVLLLAFVAMMAATALAMLLRRQPAAPDSAGAPAPPAQLPWIKIAAEGLVVGAVTGLDGAGGGFLVVPALVLLGGLDMRAAVGTSLLVIALKSFAGFAGHGVHVDIDWVLTGGVSVAAILGAFGGARLSRAIRPEVLRRGFGVFVLVMAVVILVRELGVASVAAAL